MSDTVRTSIDIPRDLHRRVHAAAARLGCSARRLILDGIEQVVRQGDPDHPVRRLSLDESLIKPAGRRIDLTNDQIAELLELP